MVREYHAISERFVDRASFCYLCQAFSLGFVEITTNMNAAYDFLDKSRRRIVTVFTVFRMYPRQIVTGSDRFKRKSFVAAVKSQGYTRTGRQRA